MNKTLVFKNNKGYDLFVPTPNGAGRRLHAGKCVSGSFYITLANNGTLTHVPESKVNEGDIVWNAELSGYQYPPETPKAAPVPAVETAPLPVQEVSLTTTISPVPAPIPESVPVVGELTPEILSQKERDLYKLGMEELRLIAAHSGMDFGTDTKKKVLIKGIMASQRSTY